MTQSLAAPSPRVDQDSEQVKFIHRLVDKVKYCKEVLENQCDGEPECGTGREWGYGIGIDSGWEWKNKDMPMTLR